MVAVLMGVPQQPSRPPDVPAKSSSSLGGPLRPPGRGRVHGHNDGRRVQGPAMRRVVGDYIAPVLHGCRSIAMLVALVPG